MLTPEERAYLEQANGYFGAPDEQAQLSAMSMDPLMTPVEPERIVIPPPTIPAPVVAPPQAPAPIDPASAALSQQIFGASAPQTVPDQAPADAPPVDASQLIFAPQSGGEGATASDAPQFQPRVISTGTGKMEAMGETTQKSYGPRADAVTAEALKANAAMGADLGKQELQAAEDARGKTDLLGYLANESRSVDEANLALREKQRADFLQTKARAYEEASSTGAVESKINPDAFWGEGMGKRIMGAFAVFMGGISSSILGGENEAYKIIRQQIDDNIAAQKQNNADKRQAQMDKLQGARNVYEIAKDHAATESEADHLATKMSLDAMARETDHLMQLEQEPVRKAQMEALKNQLDQASLEKAAELEREASGQEAISTQSRMSPKGTMVTDPEMAHLERGAKKAKLQREIDGAGAEDGTNVPNYGQAVSSGAATEARQLIDARNGVIAKIGELRKARAKDGPRLVGGGGKILQEMAANDVARIIAGGGKTTDVDVESGKKIVPNPEDLISPNFEEKLNTLEKTVHKQFNDQMKTRIKGWQAPK